MFLWAPTFFADLDVQGFIVLPLRLLIETKTALPKHLAQLSYQRSTSTVSRVHVTGPLDLTLRATHKDANQTCLWCTRRLDEYLKKWNSRHSKEFAWSLRRSGWEAKVVECTIKCGTLRRGSERKWLMMSSRKSGKLQSRHTLPNLCIVKDLHSLVATGQMYWFTEPNGLKVSLSFVLSMSISLQFQGDDSDSDSDSNGEEVWNRSVVWFYCDMVPGQLANWSLFHARQDDRFSNTCGNVALCSMWKHQFKLEGGVVSKRKCLLVTMQHNASRRADTHKHKQFGAFCDSLFLDFSIDFMSKIICTQ